MDKLSNFADKLKKGLEKTRKSFVEGMTHIFTFWKKVDQEFWDELEDLMLTSDISVSTVDKLIGNLKEISKKEHIFDTEPLMERFKEEIGKILNAGGGKIFRPASGPSVILVVGVNGTGKTTSIAKLTNYLKQDGSKVMLAAADTFRAAAIDQLQIWADRLNVDIIKTKEGGDPSAVCYDAVSAAKARKCDYLIIDTAGRLHAKTNLMEELKKMKRVISKECPGAPHETLIVLDAGTGKNALVQAKTFSEASQITGIILTKLDGTAKGGIVISIADEMSIPVKFIGFGEQLENWGEFNGKEFLDALFLS